MSDQHVILPIDGPYKSAPWRGGPDLQVGDRVGYEVDGRVLIGVVASLDPITIEEDGQPCPRM
ncbi:hypothetical protein CH300_00165 [Rhodococcus sp. 15-1154-1]|nr:hypothetical protein [Rhodococcus sp. 15-1154-1]OZF09830.1 hypothetical protein CH300_00165 [Rhodococcus sp. 15-1154-1]